MSVPIDRAGTFRGRIVASGIQEGKEGSQSVAVSLQIAIDECWNSAEEAWEDWRAFDFEAIGYLYVVKRNGEVSNAIVESLVKHANWPNDLSAVVGEGWEPTPVSFDVDSDTYQGKTKYKIGFIRDYEAVPGAGIGGVDRDRAKALQSKHGAALRAIGGSVKRNSQPAPASRPAPPPAPKQPVNEDIPF